LFHSPVSSALYSLSLHDALPISAIYSLAYLTFRLLGVFVHLAPVNRWDNVGANVVSGVFSVLVTMMFFSLVLTLLVTVPLSLVQDRKSTRLNSSHVSISYAVFCL